ncbi:hypothetical protein DFJ74DRAFT_675391 [Hyaloraphidium curvatum]|nr:hypothetical protein DFJ74DRAFT_675391 [Hyaloraphidium curvatum]
MPFDARNPDLRWEGHRAGRFANIISRTTFQTGLEQQAVVFVIECLLKCVSIARDRAVPHMAFKGAYEADRILAHPDVDMMRYDHQLGILRPTDFSPLTGDVEYADNYIATSEFQMFGDYDLASWDRDGQLLSGHFRDPLEIPPHLWEMMRITDNDQDFAKALRVEWPGRPWVSESNKPPSPFETSYRNFRERFIVPAMHEDYDWPDGDRAPRFDVHATEVDPSPAHLRCIPYLMGHEIVQDIGAELETSSRALFAENFIDYLDRFFKSLVDACPHTQNLHPDDRKRLLKRMRLLVSPRVVKSRMLFFMMLFSSAFLFEGIHFPSDVAPYVNARRAIAGMILRARRWLQTIADSIRDLAPWDPEVAPTEENLSSRVHAGFWGYVFENDMLAASRARGFVRFMSFAVPPPVKTHPKAKVDPPMKLYSSHWNFTVDSIDISGNTAARILALLRIADIPFLPAGWQQPDLPPFIHRTKARTQTSGFFITAKGTPAKGDQLVGMQLRSQAELFELERNKALVMNKPAFADRRRIFSKAITMYINKGNEWRDGKPSEGPIPVNHYLINTNSTDAFHLYRLNTGGLLKSDPFKKRRHTTWQELNGPRFRRPPRHYTPPDPALVDGQFNDFTLQPVTPHEQWYQPGQTNLGADLGESLTPLHHRRPLADRARLAGYAFGAVLVNLNLVLDPPDPVGFYDVAGRANAKETRRENVRKLRGRTIQWVFVDLLFGHLS